MVHKSILPVGWKRPSGYSNAVVTDDGFVFVSGQIGWNAQQQFESDDFVDQIKTSLENTVDVLNAASAEPKHIVRMTWYILDRSEYIVRAREIGVLYRKIIGDVYPAMAMVEVSCLMETRAKVEIETTAKLS